MVQRVRNIFLFVCLYIIRPVTEIHNCYSTFRYASILLKFQIISTQMSVFLSNKSVLNHRYFIDYKLIKGECALHRLVCNKCSFSAIGEGGILSLGGALYNMGSKIC